MSTADSILARLLVFATRLFQLIFPYGIGARLVDVGKDKIEHFFVPADRSAFNILLDVLYKTSAAILQIYTMHRNTYLGQL